MTRQVEEAAVEKGDEFSSRSLSHERHLLCPARQGFSPAQVRRLTVARDGE
jgi:hypothetical protein